MLKVNIDALVLHDRDRQLKRLFGFLGYEPDESVRRFFDEKVRAENAHRERWQVVCVDVTDEKFEETSRHLHGQFAAVGVLPPCREEAPGRRRLPGKPIPPGLATGICGTRCRHILPLAPQPFSSWKTMFTAAAKMDVRRSRIGSRNNDSLGEEPGLLHLPEVTTLGKGAARHLGRHSGALSLPGLRQLSAADAHFLGRHCDCLILDGLATLTSDAAKALGNHRGGITLNGLQVLESKVASGLSMSRGDLWLNGLRTLDASAAAAIAPLRGTLFMHGLAAADDEVFAALASHDGGLSLAGLRSLTVAAARSLARHRGRLELDGLHTIEQEAARHMAGHDGPISLGGIDDLPPGVAAALAESAGDLRLDGLKRISRETAQALARHRGWLSLNGVSSIDDEACRALMDHRGWLSMMGLTSVSGEVAAMFARHGRLKVAPCLAGSLAGARRAAAVTRQEVDEEEILGVAIIGTGFSGLGMARGLLERGWRDFAIFEKAGSVGGTWRDNTYPGCACDVPSHLYSFSFTPATNWSKRYANQPEILGYLEGVARDWDINRWIRFDTAIAGLEWDQQRRLWKLTAADGRRFRARVVIAAVGGINIPQTPAISGLGTFAGPAFHTARWRHDIDLTGRNVAVIGTGASSIQIVPEVARSAGRLSIFQRTPAWVLPRKDGPFSPTSRWLARHIPGWLRLRRLAQYCLAEMRVVPLIFNPRLMIHGQRSTDKFLKQCIKEWQIRRKLVPRYTMGCKRILSSNDYYPTIGRDNVELVTEPIAAVRPWSVVTADGIERAVDVIVLATGFKPFNITDGIEVTGRGGRSLAAAWSDGPEAFRGIAVAGFPNLFMIMGPNTALAHNSIVVMIEAQVGYILQCLEWLRAGRLETLEIQEDAQRRFNEQLHKKFRRTVWSEQAETSNRGRALVPCMTWYRHRSGRNHVLWPGTSMSYRAAMRRADIGDFIPDVAEVR